MRGNIIAIILSVISIVLAIIAFWSSCNYRLYKERDSNGRYKKQKKRI